MHQEHSADQAPIRADGLDEDGNELIESRAQVVARLRAQLQGQRGFGVAWLRVWRRSGGAGAGRPRGWSL
jgi:hypothetical protein